jgi:hypothetical protein
VELNGLDGRNVHCCFTARKENNEVRSSEVLAQKDKMARTVVVRIGYRNHFILLTLKRRTTYKDVAH